MSPRPILVRFLTLPTQPPLGSPSAFHGGPDTVVRPRKLLNPPARTPALPQIFIHHGKHERILVPIIFVPNFFLSLRIRFAHPTVPPCSTQP